MSGSPSRIRNSSSCHNVPNGTRSKVANKSKTFSQQGATSESTATSQPSRVQGDAQAFLAPVCHDDTRSDLLHRLQVCADGWPGHRLRELSSPQGHLPQRFRETAVSLVRVLLPQPCRQAGYRQHDHHQPAEAAFLHDSAVAVRHRGQRVEDEALLQVRPAPSRPASSTK